MKIISLVLLVLLSGCAPIVKFISGIREPKREDKASLTDYLSKKKIVTDNILVFSDSLNFYRRLREIRDIPQVRVYNKSGIFVNYKDTGATCSGPAYEYTNTICLSSNLKTNSSKTLISETNGLVTLDHKPIVLANDASDYYIFIYWARFTGRFNKNHVKVWESNLKKVTGCKITVFKIDMDWQKAWYEK